MMNWSHGVSALFVMKIVVSVQLSGELSFSDRIQLDRIYWCCLATRPDKLGTSYLSLDTRSKSTLERVVCDVIVCIFNISFLDAVLSIKSCVLLALLILLYDQKPLCRPCCLLSCAVLARPDMSVPYGLLMDLHSLSLDLFPLLRGDDVCFAKCHSISII